MSLMVEFFSSLARAVMAIGTVCAHSAIFRAVTVTTSGRGSPFQQPTLVETLLWLKVQVLTSVEHAVLPIRPLCSPLTRILVVCTIYVLFEPYSLLFCCLHLVVLCAVLVPT